MRPSSFARLSESVRKLSASLFLGTERLIQRTLDSPRTTPFRRSSIRAGTAVSNAMTDRDCRMKRKRSATDVHMLDASGETVPDRASPSNAVMIVSKGGQSSFQTIFAAIPSPSWSAPLASTPWCSLAALRARSSHNLMAAYAVLISA